MEVSPTTAYANEIDNWSVSASQSAGRSIHKPALSGVTYFAGAAIFAATSTLTPAVHAADKEQPIYVISDGGYFQDDRSLLIEELRQYERLEAGWDGGENDIAPARATIDEAIHFVENLPPFVALPEPMVSNDGEVGLFWHSDDLYLDVGFRGCGECSFYGTAGQTKIKGRGKTAEANAIPAQLLDFFMVLSDDRAVLV